MSQKIYVKIKRRKTIEEYLRSYFKLGQPETYFDKDFNEVQCPAGRARSFPDLLLLTRTRYKTVTPSRLATILSKITHNTDVGAVYCGQIKEVVFAKGRVKGSSMVTSYSLTNRRKTRTNSGYTIDAILNLVETKVK